MLGAALMGNGKDLGKEFKEADRAGGVEFEMIKLVDDFEEREKGAERLTEILESNEPALVHRAAHETASSLCSAAQKKFFKLPRGGGRRNGRTEE